MNAPMKWYAIGAVVVGSVLLQGCGGEPETAAGTTTAVVTGWGEPDLMGVWKAQKLGARPGQDTFNLAQLEGLYRPDARARMTQVSAKDDPAQRCFPTAFPRSAALGWPIQILQRPGLLFVFNEAYHTQRIIPTDGRRHTSGDMLAPLFQGDPAGHWEGETLVVDVLSFNGETWLAGGEDKPTATSSGVWPTSDALHVVERWRRVDADTLEYQARVEDPNMLTGAWETPTVTFTRQPKDWIDAVKCRTDDPKVPPSAYLSQFGR